MKKLKMFVWALVALFVLAGCNQEEIPVAPTTQPAEGRTVTATATLPGAVSRLALTDEGNLMKVDWAETGEKFTVMLPGVRYTSSDIVESNPDAYSKEIIFNQTGGDQFTGTLPAEAIGPFYAFYPAVDFDKNPFWNGYLIEAKSVRFDFTAQHGDWQNAKLPMYAVSQDGTDFEFHHLSAMLKFNIAFKDYTPSGDDKLEFTIVKSTGAYLFTAFDLTKDPVEYLQKDTPYAESIVVASEHVTVTTDGTASFYLYLPPMAKDETFDLYCTKISSEGASEMYHAEVKLQKDVNAGNYYSVSREMEKVAPFLHVTACVNFANAFMEEMGSCTGLKFVANSPVTTDKRITAGVVGVPVYAKVNGNCLEIHTSAPEFCLHGDASNMFQSWSSLEELDLSSFNTAEVTDMCHMFFGCSSLESLNLSSFNTAKVTDMRGMFNSCSSLKTLTLSNSFTTAEVTDMNRIFYDCSSLESLNLSSFNTSKVTDMSSMFDGCSSLESLNLSSFNTSKVTDMGSMFYGCSSLTTLDLSSFEFSNNVPVDAIFYNLGNETSPASIYVTQAGEAYLQGKPIDMASYFNLIVGTPPSTAD